MANGILEWEYWDDYKIYFGLSFEFPGGTYNATVGSSIVLQVKDFSIGIDFNFDIGVPNNWEEEGTIPSVFLENNDADNTTKFKQINDPWAKFILYSAFKYDGTSMLGLGVGNLERTDAEYVALIKNDVFNAAEIVINGNNKYDKELVNGRLNAIFEEFNGLDQDALTPAKISFFKKYSKIIPDNEYVQPLRIKILKFTGDSDYIFENFGIRTFSFQNFDALVTRNFQEEIDRYIRLDQKLNLNGPLYTYAVEGDTCTFKYLEENWWVGAANNLTSFEEIEFSTAVEADAAQSAARLKTTTLDAQEIKDSEVYSRPTNFDEIFWAPSEGYSNDFYGDAPIADPTGNRQTQQLKSLYDPVTEKDKYLWFIDGKNTTGSDDVTLGYFIAFIYFIRSDIDDNQELEVSLGAAFDSIAKQCALALLSKLTIVYENAVRIQIARSLEAQTETPSDNFSDASLLEQAQNQAQADLASIEPGSAIGPEELTDEEVSAREKKYKQCALLLNIPTLMKQFENEVFTKKETTDRMHTYGYYNERLVLIRDDSQTDQNKIVNKLITPTADKIRPFLDITPDVHATLVPKLRLYKVYFDPEESPQNPNIVREIPFAQNTKKRTPFETTPKFDRGTDYGIKSFKFSFDGETPATSTKFIKANIELFFQSFQEFIKERTVTKSDGKEYKYRFLDLFVNTKFCPRSGANEGANTNSPLHYDPNHYRVRADVGWEVPSGKVLDNLLRGFKSDEERNKFIEAIKITNKSFYLNLIDHDININDDGSVSITADYIAYIEGATGTKIMNALNSREARKFEEKNIKLYNDAVKSNSCDLKQLSELRSTIQGARVISRKKMHQSIINKLVMNGCLYSCKIDKFDRNKFSGEQFFTSKPKLVQTNGVVQSVPSEIPDSSVATLDSQWKYISGKYLIDDSGTQNTKITFFYMADLVYFLLDCLYKDDLEYFPEVENIKIALSSFSINLLGENSETVVNIGELPIETNTFIEWYKGEILDKEIEAISVIDFIKRFTQFLVIDTLQEVCISNGQHKRLSFKTMSIMAAKDEGGDPLAKLNNAPRVSPVMNVQKHYSEGRLPVKTSEVDTTIEDTSGFYNYFVLFPHYRPDNFTGRGMKDLDENNGVYHFFIGADRGLLKKIKFSKSDIQYIRESRMMSQGTNNLLQLSSVYRCNLEMIGNTLIYPGMEFYINPFGFGGPEFGQPNDGPGSVDDPNLSNIMGIGGYQMALKVNSTIDRSGFKTTVEGHFVHTGEKEERTDPSSPRSSLNRNKLEDLCPVDSLAADSPETENQTIRCSDATRDIQNALFDYNQTGTISEE